MSHGCSQEAGSVAHRLISRYLRHPWDCRGHAVADASPALIPAAATAGPCGAHANSPSNQQQEQWLQPHVLQLFEQLRPPWVHAGRRSVYTASVWPPGHNDSPSSRRSIKSRVREIVQHHVAGGQPILQQQAATAKKPVALRSAYTPRQLLLHRLDSQEVTAQNAATAAAATPRKNQQDYLSGQLPIKQRRKSIHHPTKQQKPNLKPDISSSSRPYPSSQFWPKYDEFRRLLAQARTWQQRPNGLQVASELLQRAQQLALVDLPALPASVATWLINAYSTASQQPSGEELLLLMQHIASRAADCSWQDVAAVLRGARLAQLPKDQLPQLLLPLLQQVQLPPQADLTAVNMLLLAHRLAGQPVPDQQQQVILQQLAESAETFSSVQDIDACLRLARLAGCNLSSSNLQQLAVKLLDRALCLVLQQLPASTSESVKMLLQLYEDVQLPVPQQQLQVLVDHMLRQIQMGRSSCFDAFRILRSVAFSGLLLQESTVQQLLSPLLESPTVHSGGLVKALKGLSLSGQPVSQQLLAHIVGKILQQQQWEQQQREQQQQQQQVGVQSEGQQEAQQQQLQPQDTTKSAADQAVVVLKAVNCLGLSLPQQQLDQLVRPLLHRVLVLQECEYLPTLLISHSRMVTGTLAEQDVKRLMLWCVNALENSADRLPAALLAEMLKGFSHQQQQLPPSLAALSVEALSAAKIYPRVEMVELLTDSFLAQQPSLKEITTYLSSLANMTWSQPPDYRLEVHTCKGSVTPRQLLAVQQKLQQQQVSELSAAEVGNLLRAVTSMGYCFPQQLVTRLVQHMLDRSEAVSRYSITQALWSMASSPGQQQQDAVTTDSQVHQLLGLLLQDYHRRQQQRATHCWQLSLAAWSAALCDAVSCKDTVLDICRELAQPTAWETLRDSERSQLAIAHLWLGGYVWSDSGGLAEMFTPQQMQVLRQCRQQQVDSILARSTQYYQQVFGEDSVGRTAKVVSQQSEVPSWQEVIRYNTVGPLDAEERQQPSTASYSQGALFVQVQQLPFIRSASLEQTTDDGLFSIDIAAETHDGHRLAIEFDGPCHYVVQVMEQSAAESDNTAARRAGPDRPLRRRWAYAKHEGDVAMQEVRTRVTEFRDKALAARGYTVIPVYYKQWPMLGALYEQQQCTYDLITASVAGAQATAK